MSLFCQTIIHYASYQGPLAYTVFIRPQCYIIIGYSAVYIHIVLLVSIRTTGLLLPSIGCSNQSMLTPFKSLGHDIINLQTNISNISKIQGMINLSSNNGISVIYMKVSLRLPFQISSYKIFTLHLGNSCICISKLIFDKCNMLSRTDLLVMC